MFSLPTIQRIECLSRSTTMRRCRSRRATRARSRCSARASARSIQAHEICDEFTHRAARRPDDPAARALCSREIHVQAVVGVLPSRPDGHRHHHRREPRPVEHSRPRRRDRGRRQGPLRVTAEELVTGVSTPGLLPERHAREAPCRHLGPRRPGAVNAPLIFEPPTAIDRRRPAGLARRLRASTVRPPQWGGANVCALGRRRDLFAKIAIVSTPLRQGFLTAALRRARAVGIADTLAVSLARAAGRSPGPREAAAHPAGRLSLVDTSSSPTKTRP